MEWACLGGILFCWIVQIAAAFRNNAPGLGLLSVILSPVGGFIIGCVYARQWKITQVMVGFALITGILFALLLNVMYEQWRNLSQ